MMLPSEMADFFLWEAYGDAESAARRAMKWAESCSGNAILCCRYTAALAILRNRQAPSTRGVAPNPEPTRPASDVVPATGGDGLGSGDFVGPVLGAK